MYLLTWCHGSVAQCAEGEQKRNRVVCLVVVPIGIMAGTGAGGFPPEAAQYFLVVNTVSDLSSDHRSVRVGSEPWISLKGSPQEAIKRYVWRVPSRVAFEEEVAFGNLQLIRFSLTHAGMSAYFLGYLRIELRGWRQYWGKWFSFSARAKADLPLNIFEGDVALWTSQEEPLPDSAILLDLHDAVHAVVAQGVMY